MRGIPPGKPGHPEQSLLHILGQVTFSGFAEPLVPLSFSTNQPLLKLVYVILPRVEVICFDRSSF